MTCEHRSDAIRLALLERYGGVWSDVSNVCLRPLEQWLWVDILGSSRSVGAFYFARFGVMPNCSREYVENWFLAARRGHPLISAWRKAFCEAWQGQISCDDVMKSNFFRGVDLSYIK